MGVYRPKYGTHFPPKHYTFQAVIWLLSGLAGTIAMLFVIIVLLLVKMSVSL